MTKKTTNIYPKPLTRHKICINVLEKFDQGEFVGIKVNHIKLSLIVPAVMIAQRQPLRLLNLVVEKSKCIFTCILARFFLEEDNVLASEIKRLNVERSVNKE